MLTDTSLAALAGGRPDQPDLREVDRLTQVDACCPAPSTRLARMLQPGLTPTSPRRCRTTSPPGRPWSPTTTTTAIQTDQVGNVAHRFRQDHRRGQRGHHPGAADAPGPDARPASNTGLNKSQIDHQRHQPALRRHRPSPANDQLFLYRSIGGSTPILVGSGAGGRRPGHGHRRGPPPTGVYLYQVVQLDVAGNVSPFSPAIAVTINTQRPRGPDAHPLPGRRLGAARPTPTSPTSGPRTSSGDRARPACRSSSRPGHQQQQRATGVADRPRPPSPPTGPTWSRSPARWPTAPTPWWPGPPTRPGNAQLQPPADRHDQGHRAADRPDPLDPRRPTTPGSRATASPPTTSPGSPASTDPGDTVTLYALVNGQLSAPPGHDHRLDDQRLVHPPAPLQPDQRHDPARRPGHRHRRQQGAAQPAPTVRIVTVAGDYLDTGAAQFTVFRPDHRDLLRPERRGRHRSTPPPAATSRSSTTSTATARPTWSPTVRHRRATSGFVSNGSTLDLPVRPRRRLAAGLGLLRATGRFIYADYNARHRDLGRQPAQARRPGRQVRRAQG